MSFYLPGAGLVLFLLATLFFSSLSFSLRDFSRIRLNQRLTRFGRPQFLEPTLQYARDLIFTTSVVRLFANIMVLVCVLRLSEGMHYGTAARYSISVLCAGVLTLLASVAVPLAASRYAGETLIALFVRPLHWTRVAMSPVTKISHFIDAMFRRASGDVETDSQQIEDEILSVVQEGETNGIVDMRERQMIESVIQFRDTTAGQIMTARPEIVAIQLPATLGQIKHTIEESGHSRIPVFDRSLDNIIGVLYARDLLRFVGSPPDSFDVRPFLRSPLYVPDSKPLRDLLQDFRLQKVHLAIVLDEYGGTAGLVSIEDILEELVGDIADEHEPAEPAMLKKISEQSWDADARIYVDEINRVVGLTLPEDVGYDTLGGFVTNQLGRIPTNGTMFEFQGSRFTVLDAEPQKVNRVRVDLL